MARTGLITVKLSEVEIRELEEIAARLGLRKQDVIRMLIKLYAPKLVDTLRAIQP